MIKVSILYPNSAGARFDFDYYINRHLAEAASLLGDVCRKLEVDQGLAGGAPGEAAAYIAISHLLFDSVEAFQNAFGPHASKILADIPNFTNVSPTIQINQVKL